MNHGGYCESHGYFSPLQYAARDGRLEHAKLFMFYGADLDATTNGKRNDIPRKPIDFADNEEVRQAILNEPNRRIYEAPSTKRCFDQVEGNDEQNDDQGRPKRGEEGKVAEEDEDSEPSDGEDD